MTNYFLHKLAINISDVVTFNHGMLSLNAVYQSRIEDEAFYYEESIWLLDSVSNMFKERQEGIDAILKFLGSLIKTTKLYLCDEDVDSDHAGHTNLFLGIDFTLVEGVSVDRQICNEQDASNYRHSRLRILSNETFWDNKDEEFPNLIFCESVEEEIKGLTNPSHFKRVVEIFKEINNFLSREKISSCDKIRHNLPIRMSPESEATMNKYSKERTFMTPDGYKTFNFHIKIGDSLRIYIIEQKGTNKLYVGYIGKHLPTCKFDK